MNRIYKFQDIVEAQHFLNGAIFGGNVARGVNGLVGLQLTFTSPAFVVTFAPGSGPDAETLLLADIKSQIETANAAISVQQVGGRIFFIEKVPTNGVALSGNAEVAKALLGFDQAQPVVGRFYRPATLPSAGSAAPGPLFEWAYSVNETTHVIYTFE